MNSAEKRVSEIKLLLTMFNQREVSFITKHGVSSISRIANGKTLMFVDVPIAAKLVEYEPHVRIINELRKVKGISGKNGLSARDAQYMRILKAVGTNLQDVKNEYADIPPGDVRTMWNYCQNQNITNFDFKILKLEKSDILILKGMLGLK